VTLGLWKEFGDERVRDTAISEAAIVGAALGAAVTGMRPVAEILFNDWITLAMDQIVNQVAKMKYMFGGTIRVPLVIRAPIGGGAGQAAQHSQSLEAWFVHVPGLKVVLPSTPYDAKGLLKTAIRDDNPVMFFEHKMGYLLEGEVPEEEYTLPFGVADVKREGKDVTVVATSLMVHKALEAAQDLAKDGLEVEVIDPRTLFPLDMETILSSVRKTGRLVVAHEAWRRGGVGAEIVAEVVERAFDCLDAPPKRVGALEVPVPYNRKLEALVLPDKAKVVEAIKAICS
jgi:pyruvate/2-oxoglutarate/acetoin dehydrogenase E1 component